MSTAFTSIQAIPIDGALPIQNTGTAGKALISNGTNAGWNTVLSMIGTSGGQTPPASVASAILPPQTGQAGKILSTDGNGTLSWVTDVAGGGGVSSVTISGTTYTGAVTISNVPSATTATNVTGTVAIGNGGTGATTASSALTNLGAAPLASPAFTGNPTAPTPTAGDNDTSIATTAFVKASMPASLTGSGYQKFPSGIIMQWGTYITNAAGAATVTLPIAFPTAFSNIQITSGAGNFTATYTGQTLTSFQLNVYIANTGGQPGVSCGGMWTAIGY